MNKYHIGIRFRGFAKGFFKDQKLEIHNDDLKYVPHATLLRPFYTTNENKLIEEFNNTLSKIKAPIKYTISEFEHFNNNKKIIFGKIEKNIEIERIIYSLEDNLKDCTKFIYTRMGDGKINLHTAISEEENISSMNKLEHSVLPIDQYLLRIYLLKNKLILREYDFYLNQSLIRKEAKSKRIFQKTIYKFKKQTGLIPTSDGFIKP